MVRYELRKIQQITGGPVDPPCIYLAGNLDREIELKSSSLEQLAQSVACFDFKGDYQKSEFKDGERKAFSRSIDGYYVHEKLSPEEFYFFVCNYDKEYNKLSTLKREVSQP